MADINRYQVLLENFKKEYPRFKVKDRNGTWVQGVLSILGVFTRQKYAGFTTTIGTTMYVDRSWTNRRSDSKYQTLRHEIQHVRQFHRWPMPFLDHAVIWRINALIMGLCYLFVLPAIWTLRAKFEREGYTQTLLVEKEIKGSISEDRMEANARRLAKTFGGSAYFFMWRKKAAYEWAMETQRKINAGEITNQRDRVDELQAA